MNSLQVFNYNGSIIQRRDDGFISLTQMCQANGKRIDHWKELKATKAYIQELQSEYPESRVTQTTLPIGSLKRTIPLRIGAGNVRNIALTTQLPHKRSLLVSQRLSESLATCFRTSQTISHN